MSDDSSKAEKLYGQMKKLVSKDNYKKITKEALGLLFNKPSESFGNILTDPYKKHAEKIASKKDAIKENIRKSTAYFQEALKKVESIKSTIASIKLYAEAHGIKTTVYNRTLRVLDFYEKGFIPDYSAYGLFRGNLTNFFKRVQKGYKIITDRKKVIFRITDEKDKKINNEAIKVWANDPKQLLEAHKGSFVGGLKKRGLSEDAYPGYGTLEMYAGLASKVNTMLKTDNETASFDFVEVVRMLKEQLVFCEAGTSQWYDAAKDARSSNYALTQSKKQKKRKQKRRVMIRLTNCLKIINKKERISTKIIR